MPRAKIVSGRNDDLYNGRGQFSRQSTSDPGAPELSARGNGRPRDITFSLPRVNKATVEHEAQDEVLSHLMCEVLRQGWHYLTRALNTKCNSMYTL